jgi:hypothetical protein
MGLPAICCHAQSVITDNAAKAAFAINSIIIPFPFLKFLI